MKRYRHDNTKFFSTGHAMTKNEFSQYSVLMVDDDEFSREILKSVLANIGCTRIFEAHDSETAYALARQHKPDFVLLDIYMPQVDGWALLDQLRKILPGVAAIMVTGSHLPDDFEKSMDQRVDGFCIKPVLPDIMRKTLTKARLRRQGVR
jgi:two-component system chemotaxis response regulator CheY